jgi:hypothetical protein
VTRLWLEDVIVEILKAKFLEEQDLKNLVEYDRPIQLFTPVSSRFFIL